MKKWGLVLAAAALSGLALAGCSSGGSSNAAPVTVNETMESLTFGQKELTVQKGQPVKLVVANKDSQLHDFSIDKIPVSGKKEESMGDHKMDMAKEPDLHVSVDAGKTGDVTFTPTEAGTYTFYCTVPGHKDSGMVGKLVVKG